MIRHLMGSNDVAITMIQSRRNAGFRNRRVWIGESLGVIQRVECSVWRVDQWSVDVLVMHLTPSGHYIQ
jgi:hypothetical protein